MVLQRPKMVVGAVSCAFFHTLVMCSGTVGVEKPARVRMPRPVKLERSGVMDEVMGLSDKEFKRFYRMDKTTFRFVLARVGPHLEAGDNHRGDEITPDIALACVLTWLRGGSYLDACRIHKVSMCARRPSHAPCAARPHGTHGFACADCCRLESRVWAHWAHTQPARDPPPLFRRLVATRSTRWRGAWSARSTRGSATR